MTIYKLSSYTDQFHRTWDEIVSCSKNGTFLHLRNYISYHRDRYEERSVICYRNDVPVAVFPCNQDGTHIISHGGLTYGGLIYGVQLHTVDVIEIIRQLIIYFREMDCDKLVYKAIPKFLHRYPSEEDLYALFRFNAELIRRDLNSVIFLPHVVKFSELHRRKLNSAIKSNISTVTLDKIKDFYKILSSNLEKHEKKPVHSLDELILLKQKFPKNIHFFAAVDGPEIIAGTVIYDFNHAVHCQYIASTEKGRKVGALDLLFNHLICHVFNDRQYFSFGISTDEQGKYLNEGLAFQKEGFGARGAVHDFYQLDLLQ